MRRLFLPIGLLALALPAAAFAELDCNALYGRLGISEQEGELMLVRRPGGALDPVYKQNMLRVASSFDELLGRSEPLSDFPTWLKEQHKLAVLGKEPSSYYWPEVYQFRDGRQVKASYEVASSAAGTFRHFRTDPPVNNFLSHEVPVASEVLAEMAARTQGRAPKIVMLGPVPFQYQFPQVDGIPAEALPRYSLASGGKVKFDYPPAKYLPRYLDQMGESLERVRSGLKAPHPDRAAVLGDLARYYHLAMIGHPFMRVNNSLVMVQVNVALRKLGMKPVAHGDLDYLVRSLDSGAARDAFIDYVNRNQ